MKYFVIFSLLIFSLLFFLPSNSAFGFCPQNEDWPDRPCYAFPSAVSISSEERWEKWSAYYDYKGGEWMESKKQEMTQAIQNDTLFDWIELTPKTQAHQNVHEYYSLLGDVLHLNGEFVYESYELPEALCLGGPGMVMDENCQRVRPSPYSQQQDGVEPKQVRCNYDLYRSYKTSDGSAFCASGFALRELIHRGYAESFDSIGSRTIGSPNDKATKYCPAGQELTQWGWYGEKNPDVIVTNIDLNYDPDEDSYGVGFTFDPTNNPETDGKSMIWIFVECNDRFDAFEILLLPNTIEQRKNFVVYYPTNSDTTFHFDNQDDIPYQIDGTSDNGNNSFTIIIDPTDDWFIDEPLNEYEGVKNIELSASNPDTGEVYDWMNYIIYITHPIAD